VVALSSSHELTIGDGAGARQVPVVLVTGNYWEMLGVRPVLGRFFTMQEDGVEGEQVVVISWGLWQRHFGAAADVLGRSLDFGRGRFTGVDLRPVDLLPADQGGGQPVVR
jgi:putative ABC transport system permease protein